MGLALTPGLSLCYYAWLHTAGLVMMTRMILIGCALAAAFFLYGITLIVIVGLLRIVFRLNLKEGEYHIVSAGAARWFFVNALYMLVATTFIDFILLTPLANLFYRLMGAKLGLNVQINSKFCADISLLEIGDGSVIGGHATVICHSFERNKLILKKVKIGSKVIIGLNSVILPGCEIGDGALIAAGSVLSKNTHVGPHEVYCGVPAESAKERHVKEL
jgi:acetyltransferase-like isoleucine patch superfamily enzyme